MKVYEINPGEGLNICVEINPKDIYDAWLKDAEIGDEIIIKVKNMSQEEYEKLPEYDGP